MQYNKGPNVISTTPANKAIGIATDIQPTIRFDKDIAKTCLAGNIFLTDRRGNKVDIRIQYKNQTVTIEPVSDLDPNMTYTVIAQGDNDPGTQGDHSGVSTSLGYYMLGDYIYSFTTYSKSAIVDDIINGSPHNTIINSQPVIKFKGDDRGIHENYIAEVQVSESNTFDNVIWEGLTELNKALGSGVRLAEELKDGSYYWRARVKSPEVGNWSDIHIFNLSTVTDRPVVEEDTVPEDIAFPEEWDMISPKLIEISPANNKSNVSINLKTMYAVVDGIIPEDSIKNIRLRGEAVDGSGSSSSHDVVGCNISVCYDNSENKTYIAFEIPSLDQVAEEEDVVEKVVDDEVIEDVI